MLTGLHFSADPAGGNLRQNLEQIRNRIASAASCYGRDSAGVQLLAVSKAQPAASIAQLAACGQLDFGENYLQEALAKRVSLTHLPLTWHFIGQLQANKTRAVAENFDWVHTLDRERIAVRLNEQRPAKAAPLNVCIQVRLAEEPGKGGLGVGEVTALARRIVELPRLRLRGLMCIPPPRESFAEQLALFTALADCQQALLSQGFSVDTLSMGMSADLEAAIAAGATLVRVGTALFGERPRRAPPR